MKFEQHWPRGFRGEVVGDSQCFSHTNVYKCMGPIQMHREANLTLPYKGQMSMYSHYFSNLVDLPSPVICAKTQPQGILSSEEDFL